jgi:hypothetical protein
VEALPTLLLGAFGSGNVQPVKSTDLPRFIASAAARLT